MKNVLLVLAGLLHLGSAIAASPVVEINMPLDSQQQAQQKADFSEKELRQAERQSKLGEEDVAQAENAVQHMQRQLDEAKQRLYTAKQNLARSKAAEADARAKWLKESQSLKR